MILLFFCVFFLMIRRPPKSTRTDTLFPYTTLFRSATEEFFARIGFNAEDGAKIEELRAAFSVPAERFEMNWAIHDGGHRMKVLLMVSNYGHCLNRSEEHTSELQSLMRISYAVFCLKKKNQNNKKAQEPHTHTS